MVSATELELQSLGRDDVLRFNTGDWVEIIDDVREFSQQPRRDAPDHRQRGGAPHHVHAGACPPRCCPALSRTPISRAIATCACGAGTRSTRCCSAGAGGTTPVFQDLDASARTGVINVPAAGTTLLLENGVTVSFCVDVGAKGFRAGDYWVFAARTADASVELLDQRAAARHPPSLRAARRLGRCGRHGHRLPRRTWPPRGRGSRLQLHGLRHRPSRTPTASSRFRTRSTQCATPAERSASASGSTRSPNRCA